MSVDEFQMLALAPAARLEQSLRSGSALPLEALVGFEWRGANTGRVPRLMGIQKFIKGFFELGGRVEGYNIPVAQNGLEAPWEPLPSAAQPRRYAFFHVTPVNPAARDSLYPRALLLDYGASSRNADSPRLASRIRDYLVQPDPAQPDLLLGKAYLALGSLRLPSNYFILERLKPTAWKPS
jgi:hypothetical protein